jgi:hypothetical protein
MEWGSGMHRVNLSIGEQFLVCAERARDARPPTRKHADAKCNGCGHGYLEMVSA